MFEQPYFSKITKDAISLPTCTIIANDLRHMFSTLWNDFISSPPTSSNILSLTITQLNACASDMMLNSTKAWAASYDDSHRERATTTTLALWPKFVEYVKNDHLDKMSTKGWDPHTISLSSLPHTMQA